MTGPGSSGPSLLRVDRLCKQFGSGRRAIPVVGDVSFTIEAGRTVALVGESGSGKTTTAMCVAGELAPSSGAVELDGVNLSTLRQAEVRETRRRMPVVYQDPYSSLSPRLTVGEIVSEPLRIAGGTTPSERIDHAASLLGAVGLDPAHVVRHVHQLSGGQRQRIAIARALAASPRLIIFDEPLSALDVSVQAQIIELLVDLQRDRGVAYLFISHDLAVVRSFSHEVLVMYLGRIVESGPTEEVFANPQHPYTASLLSAALVPDPVRLRARERILLRDEPALLSDLPAGCAFHTRCWKAEDQCAQLRPALVDEGSTRVACHFPLSMSPR